MRIKVEQDSDFTYLISEYRYVEVHLKCPEGVIPPGEWVRSRNPRDIDSDGKPRYFFNRRYYEGSSVENVVKTLKQELAETQYAEMKVEQILLDTNREMDRWWA